MKIIVIPRAAACVAALAVMAVSAQTAPSTPSASQLERERARIEAERKQMFDPANPAASPVRGAIPSGQALEREMQKIERERKALFDPANPATQPLPNSFPNIATPERSNIDLEALAKRYEQKADARRADGLFVFASLTMPKASLKKLIADTTKVGGAVVLRGFVDGSIKKTALVIARLGESAGGVQINPNAFTKYRITAVPAVVLVKPEGAEQVDNEGCALPDKYVMVSGDVELGYALDQIEQRSPQFHEMAARYGRPLKGRAQ
jgi:conjugal transfer pilus assembly protein TrbC